MDWKQFSQKMTSRRGRRVALVVSFWSLLTILVLSIAMTYVVPGQTQQSAYGDEWNDLGAFRAELNDMGIETTALVSSPLLLSDIDHPEQTVFIVSGVERDTISLPRFTGDDDVIQFSEGDGYTSSEIMAIRDFVNRGGTVMLMDDFGYSSNLAAEFGLEYTNHRLYADHSYDTTLGSDFVWVNTTSAFNFTSAPGTQTQVNPCLRDLDKDGVVDILDNDPDNPEVGANLVNSRTSGLCAHRYLGIDEFTLEPIWDWTEEYELLTNTPSAFEKASSYNPAEHRYVIARTTQDSWLDNNDDGNYTVGGYAALGIQGDEQGPFPVYVRYCDKILCRTPDSGRIHFISDGSILINSLYDPDFESQYLGLVPDNDNRKWVLDLIAEALLLNDNGTSAGENSLVIFDESRHQQPTLLGDTYNLLYYLLIYFTNDWMAMLILFLALFIFLEAVLIRKEDPEDWKHVFRVVYYGFGDARRYEYYQRPEKIRQVLLTRVRNINALTREEFDALPAAELQQMIRDPVLIRFIFEDRRYRPDELVGIVKRIKQWGAIELGGE
ncbi:MAG: hypothetical protein CMA54_02315 [Euryarchaeota archaeon]|jgi:hypothetical protein|nr:hypothetical protein [Euryarchaeota archaeon]MBV43602.1 hypothetical protein [Euryarchaeota archaeon]|tara:strand:- start:140847 stop:142502 length:1656 start_codon:yes stop_codon:yes gene_type:complete